jgi:hypothetical protein
MAYGLMTSIREWIEPSGKEWLKDYKQYQDYVWCPRMGRWTR